MNQRGSKLHDEGIELSESWRDRNAQTKAIIMANYHVTKDRDGGQWRITREGSDRASGFAPTQAEAEKIAKDLAGSSGGGEVRIHRPDGPIRDSDTVAPGNDPNPPKDRKH